MLSPVRSDVSNKYFASQWQILATSSGVITEKLLEFCYSGFLVPVLGSVLFQVRFIFLTLQILSSQSYAHI